MTSMLSDSALLSERQAFKAALVANADEHIAWMRDQLKQLKRALWRALGKQHRGLLLSEVENAIGPALGFPKNTALYPLRTLLSRMELELAKRDEDDRNAWLTENLPMMLMLLPVQRLCETPLPESTAWDIARKIAEGFNFPQEETQSTVASVLLTRNADSQT